MNIDYSKPTETACCLSRGSVINYAKVKRGDVCLYLGLETDVNQLAEKVGDEGSVFVVDIDERLILKAQKNIQKLGGSNIHLVRSEDDTFHIESQTIDYIVLDCMIYFAKNKQKLWHEIYRVLKKRGRFVIRDFFSEKPMSVEYRNNPEMIAACLTETVTKEEYLRIVDNAGFLRVAIIEESQPYEKGKILVSGFIIAGEKQYCCC